MIRDYVRTCMYECRGRGKTRKNPLWMLTTVESSADSPRLLCYALQYCSLPLPIELFRPTVQPVHPQFRQALSLIT